MRAGIPVLRKCSILTSCACELIIESSYSIIYPMNLCKMQPLKELTDGLDILHPFLSSYGFQLEGYENGMGSGGQFTNAHFHNGRKKFIIGYRYSVGVLQYGCEDFKVSHEFYLDHLGFAAQKQFPDFQSGDKILAFQHILHDLDLLVSDFFMGDCSLLKEAAVLEGIFQQQNNEMLQREFQISLAGNNIGKARQAFKEKDFAACLSHYHRMEGQGAFSALDLRIIDYCADRLGISRRSSIDNEGSDPRFTSDTMENEYRITFLPRK